MHGRAPHPPGDRTILLVHGLWLTPLAWEHWVARFEEAGHTVLAPAWPLMGVGVAALRKDPSVMDGLGVTEVADHYERIIRSLAAPPVLMGHSFGGLVTQILLDRGLGSTGVAIDSAPVRGVRRLPASSLRAAFPVLRNPANRRRTVALTPEQWHRSFCGTLDRGASDALYERYHVPTPGRPLWQAATANLRRRPQTRVNLRNDTRAPLLFIAGGADRVVPPVLNRENVERYETSRTVTDYHEFPGRPHFTIGVPGWEAVADYALAWAVGHSAAQRTPALSLDPSRHRT